MLHMLADLEARYPDDVNPNIEQVKITASSILDTITSHAGAWSCLAAVGTYPSDGRPQLTLRSRFLSVRYWDPYYGDVLIHSIDDVAEWDDFCKQTLAPWVIEGKDKEAKE